MTAELMGNKLGFNPNNNKTAIPQALPFYVLITLGTLGRYPSINSRVPLLLAALRYAGASTGPAVGCGIWDV
jgi:hypothetical protein